MSITDRRAFIALVGGMAAWPLAAGAQQSELAINLKTAKALGLEIPPPVFRRATIVIE